MPKIKSLPFWGLTFASCLLPVGFAQAQPELRLVVTANRTATPVNQSLAAVTVIDRETLANAQTSLLTEVLQAQAGLDISANGGYGKPSFIYLRGTASDHTLILVDGVKINSATTGTANLDDIPIDQIERIEIVRGPKSSLYGSEAIGGVIQIFRRQPKNQVQPRLQWQQGSHHTQALSAGVGGRTGKAWFDISAQHWDSQGYDVCRTQTEMAGCYTDEADADGYQRVSGRVQFGYAWSLATQVQLEASYTQGENAYDGGFSNQGHLRQTLLQMAFEHAATERWHHTLRAGRYSDQADEAKDGVFNSQFYTHREQLNWTQTYQVHPNHKLTAGVDYQQENIDSLVSYAQKSRDIWGLFAQYEGQAGAQDWQLSARYDDYDRLDQEVTGGIAWGYRFSPQLKTYLSYATAYKAPSFNELYYPNYGNAHLAAETSKSAEWGFKGALARWQWQAALYETRINDLITYDAFTQAAANVDQAKIRGLELSTQRRWLHWQLQTSLAWVDTQQKTGVYTGKELARRAPASARVDLDYYGERYRLGATVSAYQRRYEDSANQVRLGGYGVADVRASYQIRPDWHLGTRIANVFDKHYETAHYYNMPGRTWWLSLEYRPQM
ncbi:vitamin B12 transporter [Allopseudospirillum japonicum]|uniref:Vitamin B12 transporter n=1 Tax=Allopseudospirillum japonicum TaxID=64971 RepID=A0A1H6U7B6_9GAMM|nr:TonB-dependent receptor [Allopseudospirillum japonicum]SEI83772.1 vitamin B12 transporter [Allopseudospirillum japonicum]